jgi:hypothetical protein
VCAPGFINDWEIFRQQQLLLDVKETP